MIQSSQNPTIRAFMLKNTEYLNRNPKAGLIILERLYEENFGNKSISNSLINAHIRFKNTAKAMELIKSIPLSRRDVQSLKFRAWEKHIRGERNLEKALWNCILSKQTYLSVDKKNNLILSLKKTKEANKLEDIILFSKVYNESIRLPFFLTYYRNLGVTKFFIIDNNSSDDSLSFLMNQEDCNVFWTNESHNEALAGTAWINQIMHEYAIDNQWCLFADADEFLVYPNCEKKSLRVLSSYMEENKEEAMVAYLLDIFPKNLEDVCSITSSDNLITKSPFFYNNYRFYNTLECPYQVPRGGLYGSFKHIVPLVKTGLFKYKKDFNFLVVSHVITPLTISKLTSSYLHCKFIGDVNNRFSNDLTRKEYAGGSKMYSQYKEIFNDLYLVESFDFSQLDKAIKFENSKQLEALGLIESTNEWHIYDK